MPEHHRSREPSHCPNPSCVFHRESAGWRFKKAGFFHRLRPPCRVQRYRCTHCGRSFSSQTFKATYWLKRPDLWLPLFWGEVGGSGHRQQARAHRVAHTTVQRQIRRMARHGLLVHERFRPNATRALANEPVVMDGLRGFAGGQDYPFEITSLVGADSYYGHDFVLTERRRSGTMTEAQKERIARNEKRLGRPDPQGLRKDCLELLEATLPQQASLELRTDEEPAYRWALKRLGHSGVRHETISSKAPRTPHNPLFAINNAHHAFMRHSGSHLKRETIAFPKCFAAAIGRQAIYQLFRNFLKHASERRRDGSPAQRLGLVGRMLKPEDLLTERIFPTRLDLRPRVRRDYEGRYPSRFLARQGVHQLKYAF